MPGGTYWGMASHHLTGAYLGARNCGEIAQAPRLAGCRLLASGKVRDLYELDDQHLLFVTTDRISAFDVVMGEGVPGKGRLLNAIATFWFESTRDVVPNHLVSTSVDDLEHASAQEREQLAGRISIVRRARPTPVEWVVRGYLAGSGWKDYQSTGQLFGQAVPAGLELCAKLPEPLLTPTTKDEHKDRPLSLDAARERVGEQAFEAARSASLALFEHGTRVLATHGILLADTKFEFGLDGQRLVLIDEVLTPDSSRFWPKDGYAPGREQPSFDKQILRNWLERQPWNKLAPAPPVDPAVLEHLAQRYRELCLTLTGALPEEP